MRLLLTCLMFPLLALGGRPPNIVMFLTDDQDFVLSGMEPMVKAKQWFEHGHTFTNAFVSTPVCCPSRSSLLTGRYQHNTHVVNNSRSGNCYGDEWKTGLESRSTFAAIIHDEADYETFYAGKYLNFYNGEDVPKGWDDWHGLVGNSKYYNYDMNNNGVNQHHGSDYEKDYLTNVIGQYAQEFLEEKTEKPFLMVLAPPARRLMLPSRLLPNTPMPTLMLRLLGCPTSTTKKSPTRPSIGSSGVSLDLSMRPILSEWMKSFEIVGGLCSQWMTWWTKS